MRTNVLVFLTSVLILVGLWNILGYQKDTQDKNPPTRSEQKASIENKQFTELTPYIQSFIKNLEQHHFSKTKPGYVGNIPFANNEKYLPIKKYGYYKKWEVYPQKNDHGKNTLERIISGKQGEIYYTNTHYGDSGMPAFYLIKY